jgi:hypothetical protein
MECPHCRAKVPPSDESIVICLECAMPLRIVDGRAEETDPGAVRAPVEHEPTDRADAPPVTELPPDRNGPTQLTSHEPAPLPPPPLSVEPNAPSAPVAAADDRTPIVPIAAAAAKPPSAKSRPTPTAQVSPLASGEPAPRRGISVVAVVVVLVAIAITIALLR